MAEVSDTTAVLLWPARMTWVGPETITSLIEAHGTARDAMLRPTWHGDPGWPVLLPTSHLAALRAVAPDRMPPTSSRTSPPSSPAGSIEVGDPGVALDVETRCRPTCRPTRARPIRRPATPTNGAPTSQPRPVSREP